jgi:hypothetical protein
MFQFKINQDYRLNTSFANSFNLDFLYRHLNCRRHGNCHILLENDEAIILTIGPHFPGVIMAVVVIVLSTLLLNIISINEEYHYQYNLISITLAIFNIILLSATSLIDSGIVYSSTILQHTNTLILEDLIYCDVCNIYQSEYTKHCNECNCCIEYQHHHCPWIGKCIGRKNKIYFFLFNICWVSYLIYFLFLSYWCSLHK